MNHLGTYVHISKLMFQECITSYFKGEKQSLQEWDLRIGGYIFPTINENRILNVQLKLLDDYM